MQRVPDLFLNTGGGTRVHHLNYGLFLLAAVGAGLLFAKLNDVQRSVCAVVYGSAMASLSTSLGCGYISVEAIGSGQASMQ